MADVTGFSQWALATTGGPTAARVVALVARGLRRGAIHQGWLLLALGGAATVFRRRRR